MEPMEPTETEVAETPEGLQEMLAEIQREQGEPGILEQERERARQEFEEEVRRTYFAAFPHATDEEFAAAREDAAAEVRQKKLREAAEQEAGRTARAMRHEIYRQF
jgi:hypothetical protein